MVFAHGHNSQKRERERKKKERTQIHLLFCTQTHSTKETKERGEKKTLEKDPNPP
jgi:hypothetical protein